MGIPMYREPSSAEATKNNAIKDPCVAARSAIRRQPTVRGTSRYGGSAFRNATLRSPFPRPLADEIEREANGLPRHAHSPIPNPALGGDSFDLTSGSSDSSRREAGQRLLHDAIRHGRPGQRLRIPRNSSLPELFARTLSAADANNRMDQEHPPFTPRFAPAVAYHRPSTPPLNPDTFRSSPMPRPDAHGGDAVGPLNLPLLRRIGHRSINDANLPSREAVPDGLGDRQRSVSLDDDHANDAWETLLTTITPDTNLPSADSSFASSASGPNVPRSPRTVAARSAAMDAMQNSLQNSATTVQMIFDPNPEYLNPCDYPSSTDSDTESETEITQQSLFRRYRRRMRQVDSLRRSHNLQLAMNNPPPIPTISFAFSDSSADQDLNQMQAILDRLARREDIPDDWWAAAGLSRTLGQRTGANEDSNDT